MRAPGVSIPSATESEPPSAAAPARPRTNARRMPMVGWYDPRQLFKTAIEVAISTVFGRHSDFRILEALATGDEQVYDYTCHYFDDLEDVCRPDPSRPRDSIWLDYVADVSDGWNPTYAVAYHLAQPEHKFSYKDPATGGVYEAATKRGAVLVFGGDEVYPTASRAEYKRRLVGPYRTALPYSGAEPPHVFAVPGNHDWYDSLVSFTRLFTSRPWFAGWRTRQSRSYFALKLPHGWWLLGTDFQLASDIDAPQVAYFERVAALMDEEKSRTGEEPRIILCHAEPHWISAAMYEGIDPDYGESNLQFLESKLGARVAVFIAGDLHHYRRHEADDDAGVTQKITAGGGGAFLHPTHYGLAGRNLDLIEERPSGRKFELKACFPPKAVSRRLCWRNLIFPYLKGNASRTFGLLTAALYLLTTLSVLGRMDDPNMKRLDYRPGMITATALNDVLNSRATLFWVLLIVVGFFFFTDTHSRLHRFLMGGAHALAHVLTAFAVAAVSVSFVARVSSEAWVWHAPLSRYVFALDWRAALAGALVVLGGFVFGSLVMGLYLLVSMNVFGRHSGEAFSSIAVEDWKSFLRLHIDEGGALTIYPVGLRSVPRRWEETPGPDGSEVAPAAASAPAPELIEPPIVLKKARTETGVVAAARTPEGSRAGAR